MKGLSFSVAWIEETDKTNMHKLERDYIASFSPLLNKSPGCLKIAAGEKSQTHIRLTDGDQLAISRIKKIMEGRGFPLSTISLMDAIRFSVLNTIATSGKKVSK